MDGSMFEGLGEFIMGVTIIAIVSVVAWVGYGVYCLFGSDNEEFVTQDKIVPEMRFVTDGKVIDTVYVYKVKE